MEGDSRVVTDCNRSSAKRVVVCCVLSSFNKASTQPFGCLTTASTSAVKSSTLKKLFFPATN